MQVENFDQYKELRRPLPERESRVFPCTDSYGVCLRAYSLALACEVNGTNRLYILVEHGGGKEAWRIESDYLLKDMLQNMGERALYALLFSYYKGASEAHRAGVVQTRLAYGVAFVQGRLKKKKKDGRYTVFIQEPEQTGGTNGQKH